MINQAPRIVQWQNAPTCKPGLVRSQSSFASIAPHAHMQSQQLEHQNVYPLHLVITTTPPPPPASTTTLIVHKQGTGRQKVKFSFGVIPSIAEDLLLALLSGVTSGRLRRPYGLIR